MEGGIWVHVKNCCNNGYVRNDQTRTPPHAIKGRTIFCVSVHSSSRSMAKKKYILSDATPKLGNVYNF